MLERRSLLCVLLFALLTTSCGGADISDNPPDDGPTFDQVIEIDGLDGPVEARFDEAGILHLSCQSDADCFAAQGYFHAAHRFFQMDLRRRVARGRLSELVGTVTLATDHEYRTLLATRDGGRIEEQMWAAASPDTKAAIGAYTRGVNAWLDDLRNEDNGARAALEYDFFLIEKRFDDWTVLDSVACFLPVIEGLTNSSAEEIAVGEAFAALDPAIANDLFGPRPASPSAILSSAEAVLRSAGTLDHSARWLRRHRELLRRAGGVVGPPKEPGEIGSNNWIVAPSKGGGAALLANDPHLPLSNPALWYLINIDSRSGEGSLHVAGASFPGIPGVLFGQNEHIAWGVTTAMFDQADVYVETLSEDGTAVVFNGQEVPITTVEYEYQVSGKTAPTVRTAQYVPHHGPILSIDTSSGTALSLRWAAQDADTDLNLLVEIARAASVAEARAAIGNVTSVGQNFVVVDRAGSLGWFPYNRVPERPWADSAPAWLPLPGDGSAEWGDYIAYDDLPQAIDPEAGYLATANNDMTGAMADGDPTNDGQEALQAYVAMGFRHERIVERLAAQDDHDLASMQSIQADVYSLVGERTVPALLAAAADATLSARAQKVVAALEAWDFECPTGLTGTAPDSEPATGAAATSAIGCAAFHVTIGRLRPLVFGDELAAADVDQTPRWSALVLALSQPDALSQSYWDDVSTAEVTESQADIVATALDAAGSFLEEELGTDSASWQWGKIHTVTLRADLFDAAGITSYNNGPYANDGALATVDVAAPERPSREDFSHLHGASMRLACQAAEGGVDCTVELPGGQRHFVGDDPHYDDLLQRWLVNEPTPLAFDKSEAEAAAVQTIQLVSPGVED